MAAAGLGLSLLAPATGRVPRPVLIAVGCGAAVFLVAAVLSATPVQSLLGRYPRYEGIVAIAGYGLALVAGARLLGPDAPEHHRGTFVSAVSVAALITAAVGLGQVATDPGSRVIGLLGNSSILGNWALIALLLLGWQWLEHRRRLWLAGVVASAFILVLAASRAALLAAAVALVAMPAWMLAVRTWRTRSRPAWWWGPAVAAVLAVATFVLPTTGSRLTGSTPFAAATIEGRFILWRETWSLIAANPLLGVGPSGFVDRIGAFHTRDWAAAVGPYAPPDSPHNLVLQVLASTGFAGLAAALGVLAVIAVVLWRRRPWDAWQAGAVSAVAAVGLSYLFSFTDPATTTVALVVLGGALAEPVGRQSSARSRTAEQVGVAIWTAAAIALAGSALLAEARFSSAATPRAPEADALVAAADTRPWDPDLAIRVGASVAALADQGLVSPEPGARLVSRACAQLPSSTSCRLTLGDLQTLSGEPLAAITTLSDALRLDPVNVDGWLKLGIAQAEAGAVDAAEASFLTAAELRPSAPEPWQDLAALYRRAGRDADADEAAARAEKLGRR